MFFNHYRSASMLPIKLFLVFILFFCILNHTKAQDDRSYQHGINFLQRPDNQWLLIWSSSGSTPPGTDINGNWSHDIFSSLIDPQMPIIRPVSNAATSHTKSFHINWLHIHFSASSLMDNPSVFA